MPTLKIRLFGAQNTFRPVDPVRFDPSARMISTATSTEGGTGGEAQGVVESRMVEKARLLLDRLSEEAKNGAAWFSVKASRWGRVYLTLGLPAAVLAAVAGATALASTTSRIVAGFIALGSACFSAAAAFLDSRNNQQRFEALAASWSALGSDVEAIVTFDATRLADTAEHVTNLENAPTFIAADDVERQNERTRRARAALGALETQLQSKVENLLSRQKDLLAGKVVAPDPSTKAPASATPSSSEDWPV